MNSNALVDLFFSDLKSFNTNNFKVLLKADFSAVSPIVHKACSSVVTRYFIFKEKHPELNEADLRMLYFMLKIDLIAKYFSEYPSSTLESLQPFQEEMKKYIDRKKEGDDIGN